MRKLGFVLAALTAAVLGVASSIALRPARAPVPEITGYVLREPRPLPDVELIDEHAAVFRRTDFRGSWSFLYLGYTFCPDVCPLALVTLATLKRELATDFPAAELEFYLVSVDPQRDSPERLREYVAYFDPGFHGLTGSPAELAALAAATSSVFFVPEGQGSDNYLVDHSSNVILLSPAGELHAIFTPPHDPAQLAADFAEIYAAHGGPPTVELCKTARSCVD
jgi:protein SCO1/2